MLSIGKLGTGQESYYLEKVAEGAEDYYSRARARRRAIGSDPPPPFSASTARSTASS
jgi:hypothetical protein